MTSITAFPNTPRATDRKGVPLPLFKETLPEAIRRIRGQGAKVALFSGTVIKEDLTSVENQKMEQYSAALREIAGETGCVLADTRNAFCDALRPTQKPGCRKAVC